MAISFRAATASRRATASVSGRRLLPSRSGSSRRSAGAFAALAGVDASEAGRRARCRPLAATAVQPACAACARAFGDTAGWSPGGTACARGTARAAPVAPPVASREARERSTPGASRQSGRRPGRRRPTRRAAGGTRAPHARVDELRPGVSRFRDDSELGAQPRPWRGGPVERRSSGRRSRSRSRGGADGRARRSDGRTNAAPGRLRQDLRSRRAPRRRRFARRSSSRRLARGRARRRAADRPGSPRASSSISARPPRRSRPTSSRPRRPR